MYLLFLTREMSGSLSTPTHVFFICVIEKFGSLSTPTHVSIIPVEGEVFALLPLLRTCLLFV